MKTLKEKIEVMQAALEGKEIEFNEGNGWVIASRNGFIEPNCFTEPNLAWRWDKVDYRIKIEKKKPREFWLREIDTGFIGEIKVREVLPE